MKQNKIREDFLNEAIQHSFGEGPISCPGGLAPNLETFVTTMVEVSAVAKQAVTVIDFNNGDVYRPVRFPPAVWEHLEVGDVFLMTMGGNQSGWSVVWMSPAYETFEICEEGEEVYH